MAINTQYKECVHEELLKVTNKLHEYKTKLNKHTHLYGNIISVGKEITPECREYIMTSLEYQKLRGVERTLETFCHDLRESNKSRDYYTNNSSICKFVKKLINKYSKRV